MWPFNWPFLSTMTSFALPAIGHSPINSFYPPLNTTSYISNTSLGNYGGTYSAPAGASSISNDSYNYCAMPHPRIEQYSLPPPVQNGSVDAKLVYLEYLQRHQRRTPYNILPGGEDQEYNCENTHPFLYSAPALNSTSALPVYAQTYSDPSNPFLSSYVNGSCQYPQLTVGGLLDGTQHGRDLRAVYGDKLGLIPASPDQNKVWFRSSSSALTQGSAGAVLRGVFPNYQGALPLHQQASSVDTVNEGFSCPARDAILSSIQSTDEWNEHLSVTKSLRDNLATKFNANLSSWMDTFDHFNDNFQARLCNGYHPPCRLQNQSDCVTPSQIDEAFRAGDWEWNYWWRRNEHATRYIQLVEGVFLGELIRKWETVQQGGTEVVYSHNFIHDGDMGPVLGALGIRALRWPGMGSNIAVELWKTSDEFYARVLYSGRPLETIHGTLDWVPLSRLINTLRPFVPEDIVSLCNA